MMSSMHSLDLTGVTPLWRLLASLGAQCSKESLAEACAGDVSMPSMARRLAEHGISARCVALQPPDLLYVETPTLVGLKAGGNALLLRVGPHATTLELGTGARLSLKGKQAAEVLSGSAIVLQRGQGTSSSLPRRLLELLLASARTRQAIVRIFVLALLFNALGYVAPLVTRMVIDTAVPDGARETLRFLALGTVLLTFHQAWTSWLRESTAHFIDAQCQSGLLQVLFGQTIHLPFAALRRRTPGELHQLLASGEAVGAALTSEILLPALDAVLGMGYLVILVLTYPPLALISLGSTALLLGLGMWFAQRIAQHQAGAIEAGALQRNALLELIAGAPTLKVAAAEHIGIGAWRTRMLEEQRLTLRRAASETLWEHTVDLFEKLMLGAVLVWGGWKCLERESTICTLLAALAAMASYQSSIRRLTECMLKLWIMRTHTVRLETALGRQMERPRAGLPRPSADTTPDQGDAIVIDRAWFRYDEGSPWIFQDFTLRIARGRVTEIRWPSGKGKTTLLRMLAGLFVPEHGRVTIERMDAQDARDLVCYLPQDTYLFAGSLRENLLLLSGQASLERIVHAAQATGLAEVIQSWPMQLETVVSAGGTNMSGGQRQLVLLTAAVASDRPIVLLDESLSSVDRIQRTLLAAANLLEGRTVVSVTHDGVRDAWSYANE